MDINKKFHRIPVSPIPYTSRHKAGPYEFVVDYTGEKNYHIFITDKDKNLIDLTEKIEYMIKHAEASDSEVIIENFGTINLQEYLNYVQNNLNNTVKMIDIGCNTNYIQKENKIDKKSIEIVDYKIQIKGFNSASDGSIPMKQGQDIIWTNNVGSSGDNIIGGGGDSSTGENPTDGLNSSKCILQNIVNNKVYLQASLKQKTVFPTKDFSVIVPKSQDEFAQIWWHVKTNDVAPNVEFSNNCYWKSLKDARLFANTNHLFKFVTFDNGTTWLAESVVYKFSNEYVNTNKTSEFLTLVVDKK